VKTDVHYPTDVNLLFDAIRCAIRDTARYANANALPNWRQYQYNIKKCKQAMRKIQKMKHSTSKHPDKKLKREQEIRKAYYDYIVLVKKFIHKIQETLKIPVATDLISATYPVIINENINYATQQIDLIQRRIFNDEKIPHIDKIFSIFQPHTEWINKGKAGLHFEP